MEYILYRDFIGMFVYGFFFSVMIFYRRILKDYMLFLMEYWFIRRVLGFIYLNGKCFCNEKVVEYECMFMYISMLFVGIRICISIIWNFIMFYIYFWNFEIIGWFVYIFWEIKVRYFSNRVWCKKNIMSGEVLVNILECFKYNNKIF